MHAIVPVQSPAVTPRLAARVERALTIITGRPSSVDAHCAWLLAAEPSPFGGRIDAEPYAVTLGTPDLDEMTLEASLGAWSGDDGPYGFEVTIDVDRTVIVSCDPQRAREAADALRRMANRVAELADAAETLHRRKAAMESVSARAALPAARPHDTALEVTGDDADRFAAYTARSLRGAADERDVAAIDTALAEAQAGPAVRVRTMNRVKQLALTPAWACTKSDEMESLAYTLAAMDAALCGDETGAQSWFGLARVHAAVSDGGAR